MVYTLRFLFSFSKCSLFHNSNVFCSCIIHILYTDVLKLKKNDSGAKRLIVQYVSSHCYRFPSYKVKEVIFLIILPISLCTNRPRKMSFHGLLGGLLDHEHEGITNP